MQYLHCDLVKFRRPKIAEASRPNALNRIRKKKGRVSPSVLGPLHTLPVPFETKPTSLRRGAREVVQFA